MGGVTSGDWVSRGSIWEMSRHLYEIHMYLFDEEPLLAQYNRPVDVVVISDVHLGAYDCHAKELLDYLQSIQPKILILNGDIIDF